MSYYVYWIFIVFLLISVIIGVYNPTTQKFMNTHRGFPDLVIQNIVHDVIKDVAESSCILDSSVALIRVTEASATLDTVLRLVGGVHIVSKICKLDVEHLQNTINRKERQIRQVYDKVLHE